MTHRSLIWCATQMLSSLCLSAWAAYWFWAGGWIYTGAGLVLTAASCVTVWVMISELRIGRMMAALAAYRQAATREAEAMASFLSEDTANILERAGYPRPDVRVMSAGDE